MYGGYLVPPNLVLIRGNAIEIPSQQQTFSLQADKAIKYC